MGDSGAIAAAAEAIYRARGMIIGAGAGMGVDSGLPDFRGDEGFWRAYPPFRSLGLSFVDMANPAWFEREPELAWGFYGHRLHLYRETKPHPGFDILQRWAAAMPAGAFVFTSNVDGQFQKAGFRSDRIVECHGSINHLQCSAGCSARIWSAGDETLSVNPDTFRAARPLPECGSCGAVARPNVLMFGDWGWVSTRTDRQDGRQRDWVAQAQNEEIVIVEVGAGTAVPTVRSTCESLSHRLGGPLVRINPRESQGPRGTIEISSGALEALEAVETALDGTSTARRVHKRKCVD